MDIIVKTVRRGVTKKDVARMMAEYASDPKYGKRVDLEKLERTGRSVKVVTERGVEIETTVAIEE
jgi:hypothetical protein